LPVKIILLDIVRTQFDRACLFDQAMRCGTSQRLLQIKKGLLVFIDMMWPVYFNIYLSVNVMSGFCKKKFLYGNPEIKIIVVVSQVQPLNNSETST